MRKVCILLLIFLLHVVNGHAAASVRISDSPGRGKRMIEVGDMFYIFIEVTDLDGVPEQPSKVEGAKVMYFQHTGQSSRVMSRNGQMTQSMSNTWTLTLRAQKEGTYTFGPIMVNGVKSNELKYTIGKASNPEPGVQADPSGRQSQSADDSSKPKFIGKGDGNLFMRASVSESNVYEQQALVYTVKLYTTYDAIKFIGATAAPKFDGFVVEESKAISNSLEYETYDGKTYATAIIARYIIFPQMTGQLKVVGNTYTVSVDQREYYRDPFWGNMAVSKPLQLNVTPNDLIVNVKSLPSPKPSDFSGGVGTFTISSQLKSKEFKSNQAASIEYIVTGTGNLKYVQLPDLSTLYPQQLEVYTPTTDVKANVGSSNVSGSVVFDYSFMPLEEGDYKIPPVKLVYFNPTTGQYETSVSKSYDIAVGKGKTSAKSQTKSRLKFEDKLENVSIGDLRKEHIPLVYKWYYWLFFIIPFATLVISIVGNRIYVNSHADMAAFNSKRANKLAQRRLRKAYSFLKRDNVDAFYDEMLVSLWGYLGDKLKMPTSELMRDNVKTVLENSNISQESIDSFVDILDRCEYAKYSPDSGREDMKTIYGAAIEAINTLERLFKK